MKSKPVFLTVITFSLGLLSSQAAILGGIDPATAPATFATDTAENLIVISNQFTHTTTSAEVIDLSSSTFSYQSNGNAGSGAIPFLTIQSSADSHLVGDYDVIWVGVNLSNAASGIDVSGPLGTGTLGLPASSTIVGGYFGNDAQGLSPASAVFGEGAADDVLIIAQATVNVADDITVIGTDWSTNGAVTNRLYHYQIDLQPIPEPGVTLLLVSCGLPALLRRRRSIPCPSPVK